MIQYVVVEKQVKTQIVTSVFGPYRSPDKANKIAEEVLEVHNDTAQRVGAEPGQYVVFAMPLETWFSSRG